jgi:site-specific DNA-cytosine methylase
VSEALVRNVKLPGIGLIVSNVRGPDVPLYMAGARLVNYSPISIALDGLGLNVTGFSYAGTMWICAVSCRQMLPDPAFFADCLRTSFAELKHAAERSAAKHAREEAREARKQAAEQAREESPAAAPEAIEAPPARPRRKTVRTRLQPEAPAETRAKAPAKAPAKAASRKPRARRRAAVQAAAGD